jgi:hypothetical protein
MNKALYKDFIGVAACCRNRMREEPAKAIRGHLSPKPDTDSDGHAAVFIIVDTYPPKLGG